MSSVIFDLDGTLIDSAPDLHAAANKMLAQMGHPSLSKETIVSFIGNGVPKLVERSLRVFGVPGSKEAEDMFRGFYAADPFTLSTPYPGVTDCLESLKNKGFKLGVCTNKPEEPARVILDGLNLTQYFDVIVGGDTYPSLKPDPTPLLGCAQKLNSHPALYVGDSETDALTAANAKMEFALYSGGYRNSSTDEMAHDFLFHHFDQFREYALNK